MMKDNVNSVNMRGDAQARARYHHGDLRAALIQAGLSALDQAAHGEVSLRELARSLGVSANAAYRHFADKEALLAALAAEGFRRLHAQQARASSRTKTPAQRVLASGRAYIRFATRHAALFRLMFGRFASTHPDPELHAAGQATLDALRRGIAASAGIDVNDPRVTVGAVHAWSLVHGLSHLLLDGQFNHLGGKGLALANAVLDLAASRSGEG